MDTPDISLLFVVVLSADFYETVAMEIRGRSRVVHGATEITLQCHTDRPMDDVWRAITEPKYLTRWMAEVEIEPRIGGNITLHFVNTANNIVRGEITAFQPPHLFIHTWSDEGSREDGTADSIVRWEVQSDGDRSTLTLTHLIPAVVDAANPLAGWHTLLEMLPNALDDEPTWPWSIDHWKEIYDDYAHEIATNPEQ